MITLLLLATGACQRPPENQLRQQCADDEVPEERSRSDFIVWGDAANDPEADSIELTEALPYQAGSAIIEAGSLDLSDPKARCLSSLSLGFDFEVSGGSGLEGDGLGVIFIDQARLQSYRTMVGGVGGALGCSAGTLPDGEGFSPVAALPGWSAEFDTYANPDADPEGADLHLAISADCDQYSPVGVLDLSDRPRSAFYGSSHHLEVELGAGWMEVRLDSFEPLYVDGLEGVRRPNRVGVTAATGSLINQYEIKNFEFVYHTSESPPRFSGDEDLEKD